MRQQTGASRRPGRQRGFVLVTMALTTVGVVSVVGLAIDIGRMLMVKDEMQVYSDAAAVAAALALDGSMNGIQEARNAVTASTNKWNFGTAAVSNPSVAFATSSTGPWVANPNPASGYSYVQVSATSTLPLYFMPLLSGQRTFAITAAAAAGQVPIQSLSRGLTPYTAVSTNPAGPTFGLVVGNSYDIHWPTFNGNRSGCGPANPTKCFNSAPCPGDSNASMTAVVANWGSQYHGYWGSNSNSVIAQEVLDAIQVAPVSVGTNIGPVLTPGNKQSEAGVLDQRTSQDTDTSDNTPSSYLGNAKHNGRRLLPVPIVNPVDPTHTNVIGFGQFLLLADGSPSSYYKKNTNGNSPYCALYVGTYNLGSSGQGAGGSSGASWVQIVR